MNIRSFSAFAGLLGCCVFLGAASAEDEAPSSANVVQTNQAATPETILRLPADNVAYFSESREISIQLDLLSAFKNDSAELESVDVRLIRPDGKASALNPDSDGLVTINNVETGMHVLVALGERSHGTMLFYFDKKSDGSDVDALALKSKPLPVKMTMLKIKSQELGPAIDRVRSLQGKSFEVGDLVQRGERFNYRVTLGDNNTLRGRVVPINTDNINLLGGVNVSIFYNGTEVGNTVTDKQGYFQIARVRSGVHGLVASGSMGYTAFAFEASDATDIAMTSANGETFVSADASDADLLPVVLVPPPMMRPVVTSIVGSYGNLEKSAPEPTVDSASDMVGGPIGPVGGGFTPPVGNAPMNGGGFSGGGGGSSFGGGFSGGGGLAGIGAVGALIATSNDDNSAITTPTAASPSIPTN
ncbi:carboxypeptidase-like regulatory domain-containing protein [Rubripirellula reticaptiva]|uniref:Cna protein B-type domain protein n=1 Tax=Rubripirellula reticaptiva TaxID=2528013 RepID=A0A5C6ESA5_9BACT|nr:carboxypeptidase-like regulatory domain-containing protein [Rubripirellula reticaptiva]TWU51190.1 hypothetical protein Poly59_27810 [Rubripirellula reticaptiva]